MIPLLALGPHIFEILPLTLQKLEDETNANWPSISRFGRAPARQWTGLGDASFKIEGLFFNEEFGGYADYLALKASQAAGAELILIGWGSAAATGLVIGPVGLTKVSAAHEAIGPDGIGRKVTFSVECVALGDGVGGGLF